MKMQVLLFEKTIASLNIQICRLDFRDQRLLSPTVSTSIRTGV